jgi:protease I
MPVAGKKVLMVIAPSDFRDEELVDTRGVLERAGAVVTVASRTTAEARGMFGARARPDIALDRARAADYDAVVFVGGSGSKAYFDDPQAHALARDAAGAGRLVGAICIAPSILARAGLLRGRKATVWDDKGPAGPFAGNLRAGGATFTGEDVVRDGNLVTANGPKASEKFGRMLVESLG